MEKALPRLLAVISWLIICTTCAFAQAPMFSNAHLVTSGSNPIPTNPGTNPLYCRGQFVFSPSMFVNSYAGQITKIYLKSVSVPAGGTTTYTNLVIKLGNAPTNPLTNTAWYSAGMQTCLTSASHTVTGITANGWVGFTLQTPFVYDNTQYLIIDFASNGGNTGFTNMQQAGIINPGRAFGSVSTINNVGNQCACFGYDIVQVKSGTDNAGISALTAPLNFCNLNQDVIVKVKNEGTNIINNLTVNWEVDGVPQAPVFLASPIDTIGGTGRNDTNLVLGNITFAPGVPAQIRAWTSFPNFMPDTVNGNDTITTWVRPGLSGNLTIGNAGSDYTSFTSAVSDLNKYGICGPVTFEVAAGASFTENPILITRSGTQTEPIVFRKSGSGQNPIIYGKNGTNNEGVVTLSGVEYITFDGIDVADSISNTTAATRMEYGYFITNSSAIKGSSRNTIKNTTVTLNRAHTTSVGIMQTFSVTPTSLSGANHHNRYENVHITNACNGIALTSAAAYPDSGSVITSSGSDTTWVGAANVTNDIGNATTALYGIQLTNQHNAEITNCIVRNVTHTSTSAVHGIFLNNAATTTSYGNALIKNNKVYNITRTSTSATGSAHGIRVDVAPASTANVINNVVYDLNTGALTTASANMLLCGIVHCLAGNGNANYYNNSVLISQGSNLMGSSAALWKGGSGMATIKNNVLLNNTGNQSGAAKHYALYRSAGSIISDYNLLWAANNNGFTGYATADRATLAQWRSSTLQDSASLAYQPNINAANALCPDASDTTAWIINGRGIQIAGNNTDIEGKTRSTILSDGAPDLGAYEVSPIALPPLAIASPATPVAGTTQAFLLGADTIAKITWDIFSSVPAGINARFYSGAFPPGSSPADYRMNCYWDITDVNPAGPNSYTIDLFYKDAMLGSIPNETNLKLAKRHNPNPWIVYGSTLSTTDVSRNIITAPFLSDFSWFTGSDDMVQLPVKLRIFHAVQTGDDVTVIWNTISETNASHFVIEFSADGKKFTPAGKVQAKGNALTNTAYTFIHTQVKQAVKSASVVYYRLVSVDGDGRSDRSETVSINLEKHSSSPGGIVLFPNPFSNRFILSFPSATGTTATVEMTDLQGRTVYTATAELLPGTNTAEIFTPDNLREGVYFVKTIVTGESRVDRVIKQ